MWLLNTYSKKLQEFDSPGQVRYAILSHRWTEEEVTFEDIQDYVSCRKKGIAKVTAFCATAFHLGYYWCWIDTCCINKASSAEVSESINSMFSWYEKAGVCIIYLQDVSSEREDKRRFESEFCASTWFARSWTLQELLASARHQTLYYNADWLLLGSGEDLSALVSNVTTIDEAALLGQKPLSSYCIAERMSWASMRSATRIEDVAYSLLGIFDVQMPLVYGEGVKAFRRLQKNIISTYDDETIFAWEPATPEDTGILARSPASFAASRHLRRWRSNTSGGRSTYELTSRGVRFEVASHIRGDRVVNVLLLNVIQTLPGKPSYTIGIYLQGNTNQSGYHRVWLADQRQLWRGRLTGSTDDDLKLAVECEKVARTFYVPFDHDESIIHHLEPANNLAAISSKAAHGYDLSSVPSAMLQLAHEDEVDGKKWLSNSVKGGPICNIVFKQPLQGVSGIHLGIDGDLGKPVCAVISAFDKTFQAYISQLSDASMNKLEIDYSTVPPIERELLPDRTNDYKDWYIQVWPQRSADKGQWYQPKLWQHPKQQPDLNYFFPFPFHPERCLGDSKYPATKYPGWGFELLDIGHGKWKFGLVSFSIVSEWSWKLNNQLVSKILASKPQSLANCTYSIDLDTFKSVKKFPV